MQGEIKHDYLDVNTSEWIESIRVFIEERAFLVYIQVPDSEDRRLPPLDFRARFPWEPLIDQFLTELVDDCRYGGDGEIDRNELASACDEIIPTLEDFLARLRKLKQDE